MDRDLTRGVAMEMAGDGLDLVGFFFAISWAAPAAYGGSQARGQMGAVAAGLRQSHSNAGDWICL